MGVLLSCNRRKHVKRREKNYCKTNNKKNVENKESGSSHPPIVSANNVASASLTGRNKELSDKETSDISIVAAEPLSEPKKHLNFSSILKDFIVDGKSPITVLNEIKTCFNINITYSLIAVRGKLHTQTFVVEVKCDSMIANGEGSSMKIAKHNAADNFIKKYLQDTTTNNVSCPIIDNHIMEYKRNLLNPICMLQEICNANYWAYPRYSTISWQKIFETICTLNGKSFRGTGISKNEAKRNAAQEMINNIMYVNYP